MSNSSHSVPCSVGRLDDEDEKEDVNLLRGYKREDEDPREGLVAERCITNESGETSRRPDSSAAEIFPLPLTRWMDEVSHRLEEKPLNALQQQVLSGSFFGSRKQIQRRCAAAVGSFLVFLKPSFIQLWTNDKPQKLHPTAYLDGLRGVAALFVVFHHYACQYSPALLEGWGTEHDNYWLLQFPIIRVSHNGALMVQIFFVLSGYVLSVKALKLARQGRQLEFLKSLVSSVFRRWLRLAIPVICSLIISLLIARAELWYQLPLDWLSADPAPPPVWPVVTRADSAKRSTFAIDTLAAINSSVNHFAQNSSAFNTTSKTPTARIPWLSNPAWMAKKDPSLFHQLYTFVASISYILDPFNTNGVPMRGNWPSYDSGVLWTIPVEWSGSMITFVFVLGFAWVRPWPKHILMVSFAAWGYHSGRGVLTQFVTGAVLAELCLVRDDWQLARAELPTFEKNDQAQNLFNNLYNTASQYLGRWRHLAVTSFWSTIFITGLFLGSFPHAKGEKSIGWSKIMGIMKKNEIDVNSQQLFFASSIFIVLSLNHCSSLQRIFTTRIAQYLGRISFSMYLLHMHLMWTLSTRLFPLCMQMVGGGDTNQVRYMIAMLTGAAIVFPLQFWISDVFTRAIDEKSIVFTKWVAGHLLDIERRD